ncbi:MAG: trigger factor [Mariprofundales bacterium]
MIQTEVNKLSDHEHEVRARLPQAEYQRLYREKLGEMRQKARLPGFRAGKTPPAVIEKQFGMELHQQVAEELIRTHYAKVIEDSGLEPALQPEMSLSPAAPKADFEFSLKVTTWPTLTTDLSTLSVEKLELGVEDEDIEGVVDRMMKNNSRFVADDDRAAQEDDEITMDFVGSMVDGVEFDGGAGEDVKLVLGEGRFIPGFEDQLIGAKAGDAVVVKVTFPDDYQAEHLAGKDAEFAVTVHQVAAPESLDNAEDLAKQVGFDDAAAMEASVRARLEKEAERLMREAWRKAVLLAMLDGQQLSLPEALVQEEMRARVQSLRQDLQQKGLPIDSSFFDDAMKAKVRERAEQGLLEAVAVRSLVLAGDVDVDDAALNSEIEQIALDYPEGERTQMLASVRGNREQMEQVRNMLVDRDAIVYALSQMQVTVSAQGLSAWQDAQEAKEAEAKAAADEAANGAATVVEENEVSATEA